MTKRIFPSSIVSYHNIHVYLNICFIHECNLKRTFRLSERPIWIHHTIFLKINLKILDRLFLIPQHQNKINYAYDFHFLISTSNCLTIGRNILENFLHSPRLFSGRIIMKFRRNIPYDALSRSRSARANSRYRRAGNRAYASLIRSGRLLQSRYTHAPATCTPRSDHLRHHRDLCREMQAHRDACVHPACARSCWRIDSAFTSRIPKKTAGVPCQLEMLCRECTAMPRIEPSDSLVFYSFGPTEIDSRFNTVSKI